MIRSRDQLTDPEFRHRNGWVGAGPIHLLERGVHVDRHDRDDERPYWLQVGNCGIELTRAELTSLAWDVAAHIYAATKGDRPAMSTDTHTKIRSEVERRLAIARSASPGPWMAATHTGRKDGVSLVGRTEDRGTGKAVAVFAGADVHQRANDAEHTALHDPADAIRRYTHALKILEDHHPVARDGSPAWASSDGRAWCWTCTGLEDAGKFVIAAPSPCPPITDLAESLGIDTGGQP